MDRQDRKKELLIEKIGKQLLFDVIEKLTAKKAKAGMLFLVMRIPVVRMALTMAVRLGRVFSVMQVTAAVFPIRMVRGTLAQQTFQQLLKQ
ncbi:hypothetical protein [Brevibacillus migulae]|uniref:hypothetical protein n=1 Tax=Brevibacillus migulae TaxID=1644114 RepID=UPI00196A26BE